MNTIIGISMTCLALALLALILVVIAIVGFIGFERICYYLIKYCDMPTIKFFYYEMTSALEKIEIEYGRKFKQLELERMEMLRKNSETDIEIRQEYIAYEKHKERLWGMK